MNVYVMAAVLILLFATFRLFREFEDESARNNWKRDYKILWKTFTMEWLNTGSSWKFKWDLDENGELKPFNRVWFSFKLFKWRVKIPKIWYMFAYPKYAEKFFMSSTLLVGFTDGEHFFQWVQTVTLITACFLPSVEFGIIAVIGLALGSIIKQFFLKDVS